MNERDDDLTPVAEEDASPHSNSFGHEEPDEDSRHTDAYAVLSAEDRLTSPPLLCHFTELVGTHPLAIDALTAALHQALSHLHAPSIA